mmetsp:Transcript_23966/g.55906  ORF Transcript_23966/g.55906 Transcript_23966/m.55906 type:complete len:217 (-) Transcript_23966:193-843(-)|eukprot:CAMPEP_0116861486 /NCGR_PEP_ID=MMETSP0418-20121206/23054_1 /TAXON_ID=1158023 /ORGANISM="Astrosyne radiata, Strain 13vi08-1A" /LENGTH=216 /DNA_ID=CAMNT_0004496123 /DNA_START=336 /DNA_END=986 /DNA_ORIENTATION=+
MHVGIILGCLMAKATPDLEEKVAYLCCAIIMTYMAEGIFALDELNSLMSGIQFSFYILMLLMILYYTYEDPNKPALPLPVPLHKMRSSSSFDKRRQIALSTIAVGMHVLSSSVQVLDMTFGSGRDGYLGDMSSPTYQSVSRFGVCDMMIVVCLLLFSLRFCTGEQHKVVLYGQGVVLFVSQIMLATKQGEKMRGDVALGGSIGVFMSILVAAVGAL